MKNLTHTVTIDGTQFVAGSSSGNPLALDAPELQSIAVTPESPSVAVPNTQQLTAMGTYEGVEDPVDISSSVTWNSTNDNAGSINVNGLFTPNKAGTTDVTATLGEVTSNEIIITVTAGPAATLVADAGDGKSAAVTTDVTLTALVSDANGNSVEGTDVAFAITTDPASGASLSAATATTEANGKASVDLTLGTVAKDYTVTATVAGLAPVTFTVTAVSGSFAAYDAEFTTKSPTAGATSVLTVTAKDANGNTITDYTGTVSFTSTDTQADLPGNTAFAAGDKGQKTFNIVLKTAGKRTVTVTTGEISDSDSIDVVAAAGAKIKLTPATATIASEGKGSETLTATILDAFGNTVTTAAGDVAFAASGAGAANASVPATGALDKGVATVNVISKDTVGGTGSVNATITASKDALTAGTMTLTIVDFSISPTTKPNLKIGKTVNLAVKGAQGEVTWTVSDGGVGTIESKTGDNKENAVFKAVKAGTATVTVTDGTNSAKATIQVVGPLASYTAEFTTPKPTAGETSVLTVTAKDEAGNTIPDFTGNVVFTSTDANAVFPADPKFTADDKGVKTFDVVLKTAGEQTVTVTTGDIKATPDPINVVAAAAAKINLTPATATIASEGIGSVDLTATVQDAFGNTVTGEAGDVTFAVSGAAAANASVPGTKALDKGVAKITVTSTGSVAGADSGTATIKASKAGLTDGTMTLTIINFAITPASVNNAKVGDTIKLAVEGAQGEVTWTVTGDEGVGTLGTFTGDNKENAVFTAAATGTATVTAKDGAKTAVATITVNEGVVITDIPTETVTVAPGQSSAEFAVTGGDGSYTWTVTGPAAVPGSTSNTFTFVAPTTGNFAGEYKVTVEDSAGTNTQSFTVYVPPKIEPDQTRFILTADAAPIGFTVSGAADDGAEDDPSLTATIDSLDDETEDKEIKKKFAGNAATFDFTPADYTVDTATGQKDYTIDVAVENHTDFPQIELTIVPMASVEGIITTADATPISGAVVTITSPPSSAGQSKTTDASGVFSFTDLHLPATDPIGNVIVYEFEAKAGDYITESFKSTELAEDGTTEIALTSSAAGLSGTVSIGAIAKAAEDKVGICKVSLVDKNTGTVTGPIETDDDGNFRFEFETKPEIPAAYTVKAVKVGYSGETDINVNDFPFINADVVMTAIKAPEDYNVTGNELGFVDAELGGDVTVTAPPADFGTNGTVKLELLPSDAGGTATVINPVPADAADLTDPGAPESGIEWEIEGLTGGCAIVPVPFNIALADKVASGDLVVWYNHESAPGIWDGWKVAETVVDVDYITDDPSIGIIYVEICNWSSNIFGLAAAPAGSASSGSSASSSSSGSSGSSDDCFINSVSSGDNFAGMAALTVLFAGAAALAAIRRKRNQ